MEEKKKNPSVFYIKQCDSSSLSILLVLMFLSGTAATWQLVVYKVFSGENDDSLTEVNGAAWQAGCGKRWC